jgi:dynactin-6
LPERGGRSDAPTAHRSRAAAAIVDKLTVGSKVVIAADAELRCVACAHSMQRPPADSCVRLDRGTITIGNGCVLHPRASIVALGGPIHLGIDCIVEENVRIVNRRSEALMIGESNLFEVGCCACHVQRVASRGMC